jgi:glycine cleavage system regulatory protein
MTVGLVLSVIAEDRPGLVQTLAEVVAEYGGNWIDSSMSRLGGEFAGIVRIEIPYDSLDGLEGALERLGERGITVVSKRSDDAAPPLGHAAYLELTGGDHPGIVRDISAALARHGASIEELETQVFTGSMSGEKLFNAKARLLIPEDVSLDTVSEALEDIAHDVMVEIELSDTE